MTEEGKAKPARRKRLQGYCMALALILPIVGIGVATGEAAEIIFLKAIVAATILLLISRAFGMAHVFAQVKEEGGLTFEKTDDRIVYSIAFATLITAVTANNETVFTVLVVTFLVAFVLMAAYMLFLHDRIPDWKPFGD